MPSHIDSSILNVFFLTPRPPPKFTLFPYPTLFRSRTRPRDSSSPAHEAWQASRRAHRAAHRRTSMRERRRARRRRQARSEEHTSELQSRLHLVCRLLLEKKNERRMMLTATSGTSFV